MKAKLCPERLFTLVFVCLVLLEAATKASKATGSKKDKKETEKAPQETFVSEAEEREWKRRAIGSQAGCA